MKKSLRKSSYILRQVARKQLRKQGRKLLAKTNGNMSSVKQKVKEKNLAIRERAAQRHKRNVATAEIGYAPECIC